MVSNVMDAPARHLARHAYIDLEIKIAACIGPEGTAQGNSKPVCSPPPIPAPGADAKYADNPSLPKHRPGCGDGFCESIKVDTMAAILIT